MSLNSCLIDLTRVEEDPRYGLTLRELYQIRPELNVKETLNKSNNENFKREYATALYFIMNSCEDCDKVKFIKQTRDPEFSEALKAMKKQCQIASERQLEICKLPVEDTVWLISRVSNQKDPTTRMIVIQDRRSLVVSFTVWDTSDNSLSHQVYLALCTACLYPIVHKPRRPRYLCIRDQDLAKSCVLDVDKLGITCITNPSTSCQNSVHASNNKPVRFRECTVCRFRAEREMFNTCTGCGAMLYCTETCRETDWGKGEGEITLYSHSNWCHRLKAYMEEEEQLVDLPFTFIKETTHPDFGVPQLELFLQNLGLYGQDLWEWVCPLTSGQSVSNAHGSGFFKNYKNPLRFIEEQTTVLNIVSRDDDKTCSQNPATELNQTEHSGPKIDKLQNNFLNPCSNAPLNNWVSYYRYRGLSPDSPVAALLQWPLTLYFILTNCFSKDYILGVEQEVDLYPVFQELSHLLPGHDFVINMFGKNISKVVDRCVKVIGRVKVKVYRRLYHNYSHRWQPDLVVGFNAGLAAYPSWKDTILKLKADRTPTYFTDYCHYSADLGRKVVREGCGLDTSTPSINPFRSPLRRVCDQHLLPWFSNAFIFHLIYTSNKQS
ncbi:zinc finger MYND domain-containing protein 15-like isoform X2 [Argopecten irradians]|uniref:zinc finger MYND domain-containing protein 15-like isoform X2 n=1 Tax=Argopecten irradians TaxID=31199 RepID=UPI00371885DF